MRIKKNLILISLSIMISGVSYAVERGDRFPNIEKRSPIRNPFKDIETTQRLLEMRRQQEYTDEQLKYPTRNDDEKSKSNLDIGEGEKYLFKDIKIEGSKINESNAKKIIDQYINTEMGKIEIYELLSKLSNCYLEAGYITTLVTIKSGNTNTGELIFEVKEGKIREIKFTNKESSFLDSLKLKMAYPLKEGDLLTTKAMDQGLENINVGGYNNVTEVSPTEEYGFSDILIEEAYSTTGFSMGMDDSGYKDKGRNKINMNFSQDNLLGINDVLTLNYIERLTEDRKLDKESNYDIGYAIPLGYWRVSYNYNLGDNYSTIISKLGKYKTESKSQKHKLKLSRIISRSQYSKTSGYGGLTFKENKNTMNDKVIDVSSKKYTNIVLGIDHTNKLFGGTFFGMLEHEKGVPWLGGEEDQAIPKAGSYVVEYDKTNFNINWMTMGRIKEHGFQYRMGIGGSYSEDRLLSANQFTMGDEYTVRGFKESSVAGNKGIYINNTVTYMGKPGMNKYLAMIKPFIGIDGGISKDKDLENSDRIMGFATGLKFNANEFNAGLTYSIPLERSSGMPKERNPIYFNVSYSM
ncbi:MAG: ShlB/FhaC/HecB family hemolysin secretion/activation protein [Fusobacteriaceae bacterium]